MSSIARGSRGVVFAFLVAAAVGWLAFAEAPVAAAKDKAKAPAGGSATKAAPPPSEPVNACGCYKNGKGACVCTDKKAKCDCPGDCEPVGCSEKREKEMEREMAAEVKRAQQQDAEEKKRKAAEEAAERGETSATPDASAPDPDTEEAAPAKKAPAKARPKAAPKA
jgi:hypothetical protein